MGNDNYRSNAYIMDMQLVLRGLFYTLKDGLLMYSLKDEKSVFVNKSLCTLFEYDCDMFQGEEHVGVLPPDFVEKMRSDLPELFVKEIVGEHETVVIDLSRTGTRGVMVSVDRVLFNSEEDTLLINVIRDVTLLNQLEERKQQAERILRHDMRNYALTFYHFARLLSDMTDQEEILALLDPLQVSSERLMQLLDQGLDNFSLERGEFELTKKTCNINQILTALAALYTQGNRSHQVQMHYEHETIRDGYEVYLEGDCILLERMFDNLLKNALEASPEDEQVRVNVEEDSSQVIVEIWNRGVIPDDIRPKFLRVQATTKKHGHGLGTFSARLIAEAHDGDITFESSEEQGTTLKVRLPKTQ